jgi:DNA invertase Pin-like site-specific DNA recombinase
MSSVTIVVTLVTPQVSNRARVGARTVVGEDSHVESSRQSQGTVMRVVGYLRVSTDRQAEKGHSLPEQEDMIRAWCKQHRHRLVGLHVDAGESGSNGLDKRVGLGDALDAVQDGTAGGIVVQCLDRLSRDMVLQETLLREVWQAGGEVLTCSDAEAVYLHRDDPEDPARQLIREILGSVAAYERRMVALRLRRGKRRKAQRKGFIGGRPPFGSQVVDRELAPDAAEAAAAERIRVLRGEGRSLRQIAAVLTEEGFRPRRGDRWHPEVLRRIVARASAG